MKRSEIVEALEWVVNGYKALIERADKPNNDDFTKSMILAAAKVAYREYEWYLQADGFVGRDEVISWHIRKHYHFDPINNDSDFKALGYALNKEGFSVYWGRFSQAWKIHIEAVTTNKINLELYWTIMEIEEPRQELAMLKLVEVLDSINNQPQGGE